VKYEAYFSWANSVDYTGSEYIKIELRCGKLYSVEPRTGNRKMRWRSGATVYAAGEVKSSQNRISHQFFATITQKR